MMHLQVHHRCVSISFPSSQSFFFPEFCHFSAEGLHFIFYVLCDCAVFSVLKKELNRNFVIQEPESGGGAAAPKQDENQNETKTEDDEAMKPAFPNGRRVSMANTQCCNGFQESKTCNIL